MGNKCIFSPPALLVVTPAPVYWWVGIGDLIDFYYIPPDLSMPKLKTLTLNEERVSRLC